MLIIYLTLVWALRAAPAMGAELWPTWPAPVATHCITDRLPRR